MSLNTDCSSGPCQQLIEEKHIRILREYPVTLWLSNFGNHIECFSFVFKKRAFIDFYFIRERYKETTMKTKTEPGILPITEPK